MHRKRKHRDEWNRVVAEWRKSGLSAQAFIEREGHSFSARSLQSWAGRLEARGPSKAGFVQIAVRRPEAGGSRATVRLPSGTRVSFSLDQGVGNLVSFLQAMEVR
jgi:hypothetical protein